MKEFNLKSDFGATYDAKAFFTFYGWKGAELTTKTVTMKNGAKVGVVVLTAKNDANGERLTMTMWPNKCQTTDDLEALPKTLEDAIIRFGVYKDEETGGVYEAGEPKVVGYIVGGKDVVWHGSKPRWDAELKGSVWSNEPAE